MRNALALKIIVAIALVAVPSAALAATASGSSAKPFAINCNSAQFKPKRIVLACGDGATWLGKLKWTNWGGSSASGSGNYSVIDCTPDCAAGHVKSYPVKVTLSKPKTCSGQTNPAFKQARFTYPGTRPKGAPAKLTFRCPAGLPGEY
ncbi:MAG TPA: hypothetical protein VMF57_15815 [Solirubrobacteraceae bacterium]|nr:hypothetical protein [Solirubrobacteraceae bacterium]